MNAATYYSLNWSLKDCFLKIILCNLKSDITISGLWTAALNWIDSFDLILIKFLTIKTDYLNLVHG